MDNNQTQLDPNALTLTKAIGLQEGGGQINYNAKGGSGETGAYQWMPETWKAQAQSVLGDANAPMTPENQNQVAYTWVKSKLDAGNTPAQVASMWNAGEGNPNAWQGNAGTNKSGVSYDTQAYAKGVQKYASQLWNQQNPQQPAPAPAQPWYQQAASAVGNFFTGNTQQFGKTIGGALAAPQNAQSYSDVLQNWTQQIDGIQTQIKQTVASGGDPSHMQFALWEALQNKPKLEDFTGDVINTTPEQLAGQGIGTGLEALSGGILEGGASAVDDKSLGVMAKLGQGAKLGGIYGAISGGAGAMQNNASLGGIAENTAIGGAGGAVLGAGLEGAGMLGGKIISSLDKSGIVNSILPETDSRTAKIEGWVQDAQDKTAQAYENTLPLTPTERMKEQTLLAKQGDNLFTTMAKYGVSSEPKDAIPQLQAISDRFENATNFAQQNEHALFNADEIRANAYDQVNQNIPSEVAREAAKGKIDTEMDSLIKANSKSVVQGASGETLMPSNLVERLRRTGNSWTPFNASDPEKIGKSAGYALSNAVRDQVDKEGTFPAYREANSQWGKVIHAQQMLQKISDSGKTFKAIGGLGGTIARRILAGVVGLHTGGLGGVVLDEMGSEYAAKILSNPNLRTYFDRKLIQRFSDSKATPEAITALENEVKNYIDKQGKLLRLPPGKTIQVPSLQGGQPVTPNQMVGNLTENPVVIKTKTSK